MKNALLLLVVVFSFPLFSQKVKPYYGPFPYLAPNKKMLFYLQRTINRNTLIYELNYNVSGGLNPNEPVKVSWINFEEGGGISELTFVQRKFAYGVRSRIIDQTNGIYEISLVSYDHLKIRIKPSGINDNYQAEVLINGVRVILDKIFIQIIGGSHTKPLVSFIELTGRDSETGAPVSERIKPTR